MNATAAATFSAAAFAAAAAVAASAGAATRGDEKHRSKSLVAGVRV